MDKFQSQLPLDLAWLQLIQSKWLLALVTSDFPCSVFGPNAAALTILPIQLFPGCFIINFNEKK